MSVRPDSAMARRTLRPMRPNPLMATRMAMLSLSSNAAEPGGGTPMVNIVCTYI
jgi:hypothetical protein